LFKSESGSEPERGADAGAHPAAAFRSTGADACPQSYPEPELVAYPAAVVVVVTESLPGWCNPSASAGRPRCTGSHPPGGNLSPIYRFRMFWLALISAIALGAGSLGLAAAASAAPVRPAAAVHKAGGGCDWRCDHRRKVQPMDVEINLVDDFIDGNVFNDAGVRGPGRLSLNARDTTLSPNFDLISDPGGNGFEIDHSASLGDATVDRAVCQVRFINDDQPWAGFAGTGTYRGLRTFRELYDLTAVFSFGQDRRGDCSFKWLSDDEVVSLITGGTQLAGGVMRGALRGTLDDGIGTWCRHHNVPEPTLLNSDITVQATALASVQQRPVVWTSPTPEATPSVTASA